MRQRIDDRHPSASMHRDEGGGPGYISSFLSLTSYLLLVACCPITNQQGQPTDRSSSSSGRSAAAYHYLSGRSP